ncbi:hypothetical protein BCV69DRAFT_121706 [Microstroma glucosiphilum]|uniref:Secreted protein n=1 Tax=Pseudomicrostroma glucosiphilum TaxID=1684307 RepID=A0A316TWT4_9BASI|nr:hypothetical protein BCV69DRAFT_121706 [Pseudomicrostroma glucosiphilum]PWN17777.1 hypothetical protein BCV69DRAFT_121706 [Pseudomicrostroma glucosiphilum]
MHTLVWSLQVGSISLIPPATSCGSGCQVAHLIADCRAAILSPSSAALRGLVTQVGMSADPSRCFAVWYEPP